MNSHPLTLISEKTSEFPIDNKFYSVQDWNTVVGMVSDELIAANLILAVGAEVELKYCKSSNRLCVAEFTSDGPNMMHILNAETLKLLFYYEAFFNILNDILYIITDMEIIKISLDTIDLISEINFIIGSKIQTLALSN